KVHLILIDNREEIREFLKKFAKKVSRISKNNSSQTETETSEKVLSSNKIDDINLIASEIMKCINCGACMSLCPAYHLSTKLDRDQPRSQFTGIRFMISEMMSGNFDLLMPFKCATCHMCSEICPVGIDLASVLYALRRLVPQTEGNRIMLDRIEKFGNPFGEKPEEVEELFCC
ncbi:4Fe-4S dicluster domain-containing protein, partial [Candidatus Dojkabacteria bacterium]|nr:4Fe-4S dicluster domain-containing protein [Candidatus Dojkabacteria bacterium]